MDRLSCCRTLFAAERLSPSARERVLMAYAPPMTRLSRAASTISTVTRCGALNSASSAESVGGKNATRSAFPRLFSGIRLRRRPSFVVPEIEAWKRRLFAYELGLPLLSSQSRACSLIFHPQILQKSPKTSHAPPPWGGILCRKKRDFSLN